MQIRTLRTTPDQFKNGLAPLSMERLGQVVALFGANGAGKSRILRTVNQVITRSNDALAVEESLPSLEREIEQAEQRAVALSKDLAVLQLLSTIGDRNKLQKRISAEQNAAATKRDRIKAYNINREWLDNTFSERPTSAIRPINLVLDELKLPMLGDYSVQAMATSIYRVGDAKELKAVAGGVTPFFHQMARAALNSSNPVLSNNPIATLWHQLFQEAKRIVKQMMNMELGYTLQDGDAVPSLNGRPIDIKELSHGQRVLMFYTIYLLNALIVSARPNKAVTLRGAIVLIDEPELHLHPAAVTQLLASLRSVVGTEGQVWLATHAVTLLPSLSTEEVWLVRDGKVESPGIDRAHQALEALLGAEDEVKALLNFSQEPFRWAASKFAAECLLEPGVVTYRPGDHQLTLLQSLIKKQMASKSEIFVMDFGAGKGRLATMLRREMTDKAFALRYIPVEINTALHGAIRDAAGPILAECGVVNDCSRLPVRYDGKCVAAVLCNVLHEIRPTQWVKELNSILARLRPDGAILICEDLQLPAGELPHDIGFLILCSSELQTLFSLHETPQVVRHSAARYCERLLCVEIPVAKAKVTLSSVRQSLEDLSRRIRGEIADMRHQQGSLTASDGRAYALKSQMLVNCYFALEELPAQ